MVRKKDRPAVPDKSTEVTIVHESELETCAIRLRNMGMAWDQIAMRMGISIEDAQYHVGRGLRRVQDEQAQEMQAKQQYILYDMVKATYPGMMEGDPQSIRAMQGALDHQAKLFGLYSPTKLQRVPDEADFGMSAAALLNELGARIPPPIPHIDVVDDDDDWVLDD